LWSLIGLMIMLVRLLISLDSALLSASVEALTPCYLSPQSPPNPDPQPIPSQ
jgi:hypothetical protein